MTPAELAAGLARLPAETAVEPSTSDRLAMIEYRDSGRDDEERATGHRPGGCSWMSEWVEDRFGWPQDGGCYLPAAGERHAGRHVAHLWNVLPDGRICDATADQFSPQWPKKVDAWTASQAIRITAGNDPRYLPACDGDSCNDGAGAD